MNTMNHTLKFTASALAVAALLTLSACAGMTDRERGTATGAAAGAVGGAILSGGGAAGTLGGAAIGGVIGNQVTKPK
jgi:osmotically inducible lipoprotein OsmB